MLAIAFSQLIFVPTLHAADKTWRIGVLQDEPSDWVSSSVLTLQEELKELGAGEFEFILISADPVSAGGDRTRVEVALRAMLAQEDIDLILAMGPIGSDLASQVDLTKPTIAAAVISPIEQGFPVTEQGTSGRKNLHYLGANIDLNAALERYQAGAGATKVALVVEGSTWRGVPSVAQLLDRLTREKADDYVLRVIDYRGSGSLEGALTPDVGAIFMLPQMGRSELQRKLQVNEALARRVPVLSTMGEEDARAGFLYALALVPDPTQFARRIALDIRDIALGREASELLVSITPRGRLTLNMATARLIDADLPFDVLFEANVIGELQGSADHFSLTDVIDMSLRQNLDLAVARQNLLSVYEDTKIARSALLPQVNAGVSWESLDDDLVIQPNVIPSETTTTAISLSQTIYSESKRSDYDSRQLLESAEEAAVSATRLDVIESASNAYLNVLIAKTELAIQRDNIRLTRANLERAQFRYRVGSADRSEVYRFETLLASDLQAVATARSTLQQSQFSLNEVLRRPIDDIFGVKEAGVGNRGIFGDERFGRYISGTSKEQRFADFVAAEAYDNSPELDELRDQVASQERLLLAAKRQRYVPTVDLVGSVEEVVSDRGASSPRNYNEDWQVAIEFSLPLYEGSAIASRKRQARSELRRLTLLKTQTELRLETDARNAVAAASASRLSMQFAEKSEQAARQALSLVTDSYTRGRSSYIDLIDAQTSYLSERLAAANTSYQYLLDLVSLQRAMGFFDYASTSDTREAWFDRLNSFSPSEE